VFVWAWCIRKSCDIGGTILGEIWVEGLEELLVGCSVEEQIVMFKGESWWLPLLRFGSRCGFDMAGL